MPTLTEGDHAAAEREALLTALRGNMGCYRCGCRSCTSGYENHEHGCTHGEHCVETAPKLVLANRRLRRLLSDAVEFITGTARKAEPEPARDGREAPYGWPTIDTAPADGSVIAVTSISRMGELYDPVEPFTAFWTEAGQFSKAGWTREVFDGSQRSRRYVCHPTHWSGHVLREPVVAQG